MAEFQAEFGNPPVLLGGQDNVQTKLFAQQADEFLEPLLCIAAQVRTDFNLPTRKINVHDDTSSSGYGIRDGTRDSGHGDGRRDSGLGIRNAGKQEYGIDNGHGSEMQLAGRKLRILKSESAK